MKQFGLLLLLSLVMAAAEMPGAAATFTQNQGGVLGTSSIIKADGTADYQSLKDAAADYSNYTGKMTEDYTFFVGSDLVETGHVEFVKRTTTRTLTIRPLDTACTVTVNTPYTEAGFSDLASVLIGSSAYHFSEAHHIVFDGTLESGAKGLTFVLQPSTLPDPLPGFPYSGFLMVSNGTLNIKNCRIENHFPSDLLSFTVDIEARSTAGSSLTGNEIIATEAGGCGIRFTRGSQSTTLEVQVSDNRVSASAHAIEIQGLGGNVTGNTVDVTGRNDSIQSLLGLAVNRSNGLTTQTLIAGNRVTIHGANRAIVIQGIRSYSASDYEGTYVLQNNMVSINTDTGAETRPIRGITLVNKRASITEVDHNSLFLPGNQDLSEELGRTFHVVGIDAASSNTATIVNNMARVGTRWASGLFYDAGNNIISDGNVVGLGGESIYADAADTTHTLLADWQTASGQDMHSQEIDPLPLWASLDDLHVVHSTAGLHPGVTGSLQFPPATDIDGDLRDANVASPGCDEMELNAAVNEWQDYREMAVETGE